MGLFQHNYTFDVILKKQLEADKKYKNQPQEKEISDSVKFKNDFPYEKATKYLYNALNAIKTNNGEIKNYFNSLDKTGGDYTKRESGIYNKVNLLSSFIERYVKKDDILKHSLAGIYIEMFEFVTNPTYISMFKKAFDIVKKKGDMNTSLTVFKLAYDSIVYSLEVATIHLVEFEVDVYSGKDPESSIIDIMNKNTAFMKNFIVPIISILAFFKNLKTPMNIVSKIDAEENNKLKAKESSTPDAAGSSEEENNGGEDGEEKSEEALPAAITGIIGALTTSVPLLSVSVFVAVVALILTIIPLIRLIIYHSKTMKIDIGKELEFKAELLDNNIVLLKEQMDATKDPKEKERLAVIIAKQEAYVDKWRESSKELLKQEVSANYEVEIQINKEDQEKDTSSSDEDDDDFDIVL